MTVELYAFTCGMLTIPRGFLLAGEKGRIVVPIPSYLIVHAKGKAIFDSGLNIRTQTDPQGYYGDDAVKYDMFHFHPSEEIAARLRSVSVAPEDIDFLVNSHLHYDHSGGNAQIPNADIVVQAREWAHAAEVPDRVEGYVHGDYETGQRIRRVDGEHDLFGDGSAVCIPTYGHTPGHQSLRVRTASGEFILCGDACYLKQSLGKLHLPGVVADKEAALQVFLRLREMQARGSRIMFGHDPEFWQTVPQAPLRLG